MAQPFCHMNRATRSVLPHRRQAWKNDIAQSPVNVMLRDDVFKKIKNKNGSKTNKLQLEE